MVKRGSITVFLALTLSLIMSLLCSGIESVRMAAARTQILNGLDIGLYSLFGQFDKALLEDYDLFAIDGSNGGKEMDLASVYDHLESYMKPVLKQNSQKLSLTQGGITGYRLLTDEGGEVFYQQVVQYMEETLGSQGVQLLLQKMQERQKKTSEAERAGEEVENGSTLTEYDSEINAAAQKSQEALEEKKEQSASEEGSYPDGGADGFADVETVTEKAENPIPVIKRIRWMGLLELVVPAGKGISDKEINKRELISGRKLEESRLPMAESLKKNRSLTSQLLYQQYLAQKLGSYANPGKGGLRYQIEYIISGKDSDEGNLKSIAKKLLLVREGINAACLSADSGKRAQVEALATAIASGFLIPPTAGIIEAALILCWAFAESILDVRTLFDGGKVPLIKNSSNWQLSLQNLPHLLELLDSTRRSDENGMSYEDYLQVFLYSTSKEIKVMRGMDMLELSMCSRGGWESFRLDLCITSLEASVDVKANGSKTFTVTRQYSYI